MSPTIALVFRARTLAALTRPRPGISGVGNFEYTRSPCSIGWKRNKEGTTLATVARWLQSEGMAVLFYARQYGIDGTYKYTVLCGHPNQPELVEAFKKYHNLEQGHSPGANKYLLRSKAKGVALAKSGGVDILKQERVGDATRYVGEVASSNNGRYPASVTVLRGYLEATQCACPHHPRAEREHEFANGRLADYPVCKHVWALYLEALNHG